MLQAQTIDGSILSDFGQTDPVNQCVLLDHMHGFYSRKNGCSCIKRLKSQHRTHTFLEISIRDNVPAQYKLIMGKFGISEL